MNSIHWQLILVILIGIAAIVYAIRFMVRSFKRPKCDGHCGSCPHC